MQLCLRRLAASSRTSVFLVGLGLFPAALAAQPAAGTRPWYERISLRGYTQLRYNRLLETNRNLTCAQCDRSIGNNGGLSIRRGRLTLSGELGDRVSFVIQPDMAADAAGASLFWQIRDAYFDIYLDAARAARLRIGQTKVLYGFANLQSSSNRAPLDRDDALNSGAPNERDLGVFYLWTPAAAKARFRMLTDSGYKGSGDYGVVAFGVYNGQSANRPEANNSLHGVARVAYPMALPNGQIVELGASGYTGKFVVTARSAGVTGPGEFADRRVAASLIWYPQPLGFAAEWTAGEGPEFNPAARRIELRDLSGGYALLIARVRGPGAQVFFPFVRWQSYDGGKKHEQDARSYDVRELEIGTEWSPVRALELTAQYTISDRRYEDAGTIGNRQKGELLRLQLQVNY
ncbi:MAG: porin [Gemmatimonadaceae bacterium]